MATNPIGGESASVTLPGTIGVPAMTRTMLCAPIDPVDAYYAAETAVNNGTGTVDDFLRAGDALDRWEPQNFRDFTRKLLAMFGDVINDGAPADYRLAMLAADAKRLAA
ncbi:MAG: hypothetical protein AB7D33_13870 [Sphingobium sp.]